MRGEARQPSFGFLGPFEERIPKDIPAGLPQDGRPGSFRALLIQIPNATSSAACRTGIEAMRLQHGVMISGGHGNLMRKLFRIGHMGKMACTWYVIAALEAWERTLVELGVPVLPGRAIPAAPEAAAVSGETVSGL